MAHYTAPPYQIEKYGTGQQPVKPDVFLVKSKDYVSYRVARRLSPPFYGKQVTETVDIHESDVWKVTHKVEDRFIIQSDEYNERQCRFLDKRYQGVRGGFVNLLGICLRDYGYGIYITPKGEIDGGWELLPHRLGGANRYMYMFWHPAKNEGWPKGVIFISESRGQQ
jgi:hypothetical protein